MPIAYFPSLFDAECVDADFVDAAGNVVTMRLLVDSGFTGEASIVLSREASSLVRTFLQRASASGALTGLQRRGWVLCRVPAADFEKSMIAILSNLAPLSLPAGVDGMVGLTFLRHFDRWGAERMPDRRWQLFLETSDD